MSTFPGPLQPRADALELGRLMSATIASVVAAQDQLDLHARERSRAYEAAEPGTLVPPPLWFTFQEVTLELELAASIARTTSSAVAGEAPHLVARTLDPTAVGLYGYHASSGLRVRVTVAPQGLAQIRPPRAAPD